MKLFGGILIAAVLSLFAPAQPALAAGIGDLEATIEVKVDAEGVADVRHIVTGDRVAGQTLRIPIIPTSDEQVNVRVGTEESTTQASVVSEQVTRLGVPTTHQTVEIKAPNVKGWQVELSYENARVQTSVGSYKATIIDPFIEPYARENISVSLAVDTELPASLGLAPVDSTITEGRQVYEFETTSPRTKAAMLAFGTNVSYTTTQTYELKNGGWWWRDYQIVLPPDSNQQHAAVESLSRAPRAIRVDQDGNIVAVYRVGPKKTINIEAVIKTNVRSLQYRLPDSVVAAPASLDDYVNPVGAWSSGETVEATTPEELITELVERATADYAADMDSRTVINQLIADARASGVPARFITGSVIKTGAAGDTAETITKDHTWSEIYFDGAGWMTLDPSFAAIYDSPKLVDALHLAQKVHGVSDVEPVSVPASITNIDTGDDEVTVAQPEISQTKYMIFPGLSLTRTRVTVGAGAVHDNVAYEATNGVTRLGSLAPLQDVSMWDVALGSGSWTASELVLGTSSNGTIDQVIQTTRASVSYLVLIGTVLAIAAIFYLNRRFDKKSEAVRLSEPDEVDDASAEELLKKPDTQDSPRTE